MKFSAFLRSPSSSFRHESLQTSTAYQRHSRYNTGMPATAHGFEAMQAQLDVQKNKPAAPMKKEEILQKQFEMEEVKMDMLLFQYCETVKASIIRNVQCLYNGEHDIAMGVDKDGQYVCYLVVLKAIGGLPFARRRSQGTTRAEALNEMLRWIEFEIGEHDFGIAPGTGNSSSYVPRK